MICTIHHYNQKETIIHKAWETGAVDFAGATVKILPDLSKATLQ